MAAPPSCLGWGPLIPSSLLIAVDCHCIRTPTKGVARIGRNFVRMLDTAPESWSFVLFGVDDPAWDSLPLPVDASLQLLPRNVPRAAWYNIVLPRMVKRIRPDIVHGLTDLLPGLGGAAGVVTVTEDPTRRIARRSLHSPVAYLRRYELVRSFRSSLERSSNVLVISRAVGMELSSRYGYRADRLRIAYPGVDPDLAGAPTSDPGYGRYLLSFATGDDRERWPLVRDAFQRARCTDPDLALVVVGRPRDAGRADPPGVVAVGRVSDEELASLYRHAIALVDMADFEGFGLQILEACHFGTAVIAADLPTVREITGDTAVTHPHPTVEWLAETMGTVAADPGRFQSVPLLDTSWRGFADATWAAYDEAAPT
jgi:glycosyltransferase involved in cell wall biosynthesis